MNGSGLWGTQSPTHPHLIIGPGGIAKEVADVRRDLMATFAPLVGVAIEEYDAPPAAVPAAIMAVTASSLSAQDYQYAQLTGSVGDGAISPPRNMTVTTAGTTATHAPASLTVNGFDAQGNALSETITGTNGGAATYTGIKCFAKVNSVVTPAGTGTDATLSVGTGAVIGLSSTPMLRTGQLVGLVRNEIVDGALVGPPATGTLSTVAAHPPFGAYVPATAPTTSAPAIVTGTADITASALYSSGGTLAGGGTGLTLILTVDGVGPTTMTFSGAGTGNDASEAAMLAAIEAEWPALTAVQGGGGGNKLVLQTLLSGYAAAVIVVGAGTANTALGLTSATTHGGGHNYSIEYELNGNLMVDGSFTQ
jgi:hypothetical protein